MRNSSVVGVVVALLTASGCRDRQLEDEVAALRAEVADLRDQLLDWVQIPGGTFQMGSASGDDDEQPVHTVGVAGFKMMKSEVTVGQYRKCVDAGSCTAPDTGEDCNWNTGREDHPVNCVDWNQAQAFAVWAGGRLPTEAEWEYAARSGGKARTYPWGDESA